jgi:replicative DNA helicase Mcm
MKKSQEGDEILSKDLIRKYIAYSKRTIHPKLEEEARNRIVAFYVETRKKGGESSDSVSITARSLEAVARMAEASARIRLSDIATIEDVERAIRLTKNWRYELMGENFDETGIQSGKNAPARNKERVILDIIEKLQDSSTENTKVAYRIDIYNEAQSSNIDRNKVDDILEQLNRLGRVMMPRGYDTFQKM